MDGPANRNRALAILAGFYAVYHPDLDNSATDFLTRVVRSAIR
jgi:hypothetical protein